MEVLDHLFDAVPLLALFLTISLGYFVGKLKMGKFVLGGNEVGYTSGGHQAGGQTV